MWSGNGFPGPSDPLAVSLETIGGVWVCGSCEKWLPRLDSNQQPIGYTLPFCFQKEWTISSPI